MAFKFCTVNTCFTNVTVGDNVELKCGGNTDVLKSFDVSFNEKWYHTQCVDNLATNATAAGFTNSSSTCANLAIDLSKFVADVCTGEKICSIDTVELLAKSGTDIDSCTSYGRVMIQADCGEPFIVLDALSIVAIAYIGFVALAMGSSFPAGDFIVVFRTKLKAVMIGFISQFFFMPLMAYIFALSLGFDNNIAIGVVLVGAAPGGSTSNLFTYFVDGNVALSIVMSFLSTCCEVFMLPLLWFIYISSTFTEDDATIPFLDLLKVALLIIVPVIVGAVIRTCNTYTRCGCSAKHNKCICCCHPLSKIPDEINASSRPQKKMATAQKGVEMTAKAVSGKEGVSTLQPLLVASAEKHEFGMVKLTAPERSTPGCIVEFTSYYGTYGTATIPWGFKAGDKFVVPMIDPNDPLHKDCCFCFIWQWVAKSGGVVGAIFLMIALAVGIRDNPYLITQIPYFWRSEIVGLIFQPLGCLFGFFLGVIFWTCERNVAACRCACGGNAQRLDCRDLRAISIETGVQNTPLMIATVILAFRGCQQKSVMVFILTASLWYIIHSIWYVIVVRCCFSKWCDESFADDDTSCQDCTRNCKFFCSDCRICLKPTEIREAAEPVELSSLSKYEGQQFKTTDGTAELPIRVSETGPASAEPVTIMALFEEIIKNGKGHLPALRTEFPTPEFSGNPATDASSPAEEWRTWSFAQYFEGAKTVARGFLSLGLERHAAVNIWGFNSPEWLMSEMGAIFAGAKAAGIYPTDTAAQIVYKIQHSGGQVVAIQDAKKLETLARVADQLPNVKAIICWAFDPTPLQRGSVPCAVFTWAELMARGDKAYVPEDDLYTPYKEHAASKVDLPMPSTGADIEKTLQERMANQRPGHCCALIYTSGTTGQPKAVMMSHDNLVFQAGLIVQSVPNCKSPEQERGLSYLPLSHVAGMMLDILFPLVSTARTPAHVTLHFARPYDLSKGTLAHRLRSVKPTAFLGVPRVWEKIQAKIKKMAAVNTSKLCCIYSCVLSIKRAIVLWAKRKGEQRARNLLLGGSGAFPCHFSLANKMVLSQVAAQLGLSECKTCITGAAPLGTDTLEFFGSLGLNILEAYGMSECTGVTTWSTEQCHMWGSCGFALQSLEVKIFKLNEDGSCGAECPRAPTVDEAYTPEGELKYQGEICFRGRHIMMGYMANPALGEEHMAIIQRKLDSAIDDDGWLHSGDKGIMTTAGMVKITGRYKELLIGAGGENVAPVPIERAVKLAGEDVISNVMMFGDKKPFLSALVTLRAKEATGLARGTDRLDCRFPGSNVRTVSAAMSDPVAIAYIEAAINKGNESAPNRNSTIKKFTILPYDFSVEGEELTSTLKLKRSVALQHFAEVAARIYTVKAREAYVPFNADAAAGPVPSSVVVETKFNTSSDTMNTTVVEETKCNTTSVTMNTTAVEETKCNTTSDTMNTTVVEETKCKAETVSPTVTTPSTGATSAADTTETTEATASADATEP